MVLIAESTPESAGSLGVYLLILLAAAGIVAAVLRRLKLEVIPGYLIAGVIVGPHALALIPENSTNIKGVSDLATVLLLFSIGLDLDIGHIRRGMVHILAIGVISTLVFSLLNWLLLLAVGVAAPAGLIVAMAVAMSSTAVLVRILISRRESRSVVGRVTLGVAIVQDLLSVVVMMLIPPIALWAGASRVLKDDPSHLPAWARLIASAAIGLGGVASLLVIGRVVLPRILHAVAKIGSNELVLVVSAAAALGAAVATGWLGLSPQMGAFLAGFLLAGTPFRYQLAGQIAPMRDLLMAVFFTSVGLQVSPVGVAHEWWVIGLAVMSVIVLKGAAMGATAWGAGMTAPSALLAAVYLANAGEFSLVILGAAGPDGERILTPHQLSASIAVVIITLIISPLLVKPAHRWSEKLVGIRNARWVKSHALRELALPVALPEGEAPPDKPRHIIIAGFGVVGRALADRLAVMDIPFTVIELNPKTVERQSTLGRTILYGDVTNAEVLESAGIRRADAIILTIPDDEATLRACQAVRSIAADVFIAARTSFLSGKFVAHQLGADLVTVEEVATAQAMEKEVLAELGQWKRRGTTPTSPSAETTVS